MRTLIVTAFVSADGVMEAPGGDGGDRNAGRTFKEGEFDEAAYEVTSAELMLSLVAQGLAVALLAEEIAVRNPAVRTVPVADGPVRVEYLAWSAFNPSPATRAFLAMLAPPAG